VPEILEVEAAREVLERRALGRSIASVDAPDAWYLKRGLTPEVARAVLPGHQFTAARRRGKLLLLDTSTGNGHVGPTMGVHLGMSGRVVADDGALILRDPRRLGAVELDPDEERLGVDAFAITPAQLRATLQGRRAPLKAVLMDQSGIAGLGNLLVDEILWRARLDPTRPADSLQPVELTRLLRALRNTLRILGRRGGSHTGDLMPARQPGGFCPRDGAPLQRATVGGRTTYWCPAHQA
jgi:formamidopyrimidine-DNA glycosylase